MEEACWRGKGEYVLGGCREWKRAFAVPRGMRMRVGGVYVLRSC